MLNNKSGVAILPGYGLAASSEKLLQLHRNSQPFAIQISTSTNQTLDQRMNPRQ